MSRDAKAGPFSDRPRPVADWPDLTAIAVSCRGGARSARAGGIATEGRSKLRPYLAAKLVRSPANLGEVAA